MNEVRLIQKVGQVPFTTLVENAARLGFALSGSPTLVSNVPVQLMIKTDVEAQAPEYLLVEKTGQEKLSVQVEKLLDEGWKIYGSLVTGHIPMQAMIRGDIAIHKMANIGGSGDSADWAPAILASKKDAVKESNAYTDDNLGLLVRRVDEVNSAQNKETENLWAHMDQQRQEIDSAIRGNAIGANEYTDQQFSLFDMQLAEIVLTQAKINSQQDAEIETLQAELAMVRSEHQQDVARLEALIAGREFVPQEPVAVVAKSAEYPPIIPPDSVWK